MITNEWFKELKDKKLDLPLYVNMYFINKKLIDGFLIT